jgi:endonuclease/exonuclease/phosphatase family metal-dependent hydrolase
MKIKTALLAALGILVASVSPAKEPVQLRLMTYNIRLDLASDGVNSWSQRRDWVASQVQWLNPDIFGMQEVLPNQKADLIAGLPQYTVIGGGRDNGSDKGEASPIGFNTKRFDLLDNGLFWLSATPDVPSMGWDAAYKRVATWARLRIHGTKQVVLAVNTHWDNEGVIARRESANQIARWIKSNTKRCERVMLFGDFNSETDSEPLQNIRASLGLRDARAVTKSAPIGPTATFNDFRNPPEDSRAIDHFLSGEGIEVERYLVLSQLIDGRWPSDHFPVVIDTTIPECH